MSKKRLFRNGLPPGENDELLVFLSQRLGEVADEWRAARTAETLNEIIWHASKVLQLAEREKPYSRAAIREPVKPVAPPTLITITPAQAVRAAARTASDWSDLIADSVQLLPPPEPGKRDRRCDIVQRAARTLHERGEIFIANIPRR